MVMNTKPKESDWKIFRKRVPEWRDRYLNGKGSRERPVLFLRVSRKLHPDAEALLRILRPDGAAVGLHDFFHNGKAEPETGFSSDHGPVGQIALGKADEAGSPHSPQERQV
jgi:hypothetical protein